MVSEVNHEKNVPSGRPVTLRPMSWRMNPPSLVLAVLRDGVGLLGWGFHVARVKRVDVPDPRDNRGPPGQGYCHLNELDLAPGPNCFYCNVGFLQRQATEDIVGNAHEPLGVVGVTGELGDVHDEPREAGEVVVLRRPGSFAVGGRRERRVAGASEV